MKTTMDLPLQDSAEKDHAEIVTRPNSRLKIKYCAGTNEAGKPCKAPAPNWSRYCKAHREKIAEPIKTANGRAIISALKLHEEKEKISEAYEKRLSDLVIRLARIVLENVSSHRDRDAVAGRLQTFSDIAEQIQDQTAPGLPTQKKFYSLRSAEGIPDGIYNKDCKEGLSIPISKENNNHKEDLSITVSREMKIGKGGDGKGNSDGTIPPTEIVSIPPANILPLTPGGPSSEVVPASNLQQSSGVPVLGSVPASTPETNPEGDSHA